ncbi:MAG: hypothetical protein LBC69_04520 [Eubacteriaceae bacterium]|nr:hypothetical protein [Eubacteriaceae bacterium]
MANRQSDNLILLMAFALLANAATPLIQRQRSGANGPFEFDESGDLVRGETKESPLGVLSALIQADNGRVLRILSKAKDLLNDIHMLAEADFSQKALSAPFSADGLDAIADLLGLDGLAGLAPAMEALMSFSAVSKEANAYEPPPSLPLINPDGSKTRAIVDSVAPTYRTEPDEDEYRDLMELLDMFEDKGE